MLRLGVKIVFLSVKIPKLTLAGYTPGHTCRTFSRLYACVYQEYNLLVLCI